MPPNIDFKIVTHICCQIFHEALEFGHYNLLELSGCHIICTRLSDFPENYFPENICQTFVDVARNWAIIPGNNHPRIILGHNPSVLAPHDVKTVKTET